MHALIYYEVHSSDWLKQIKLSNSNFTRLSFKRNSTVNLKTCICNLHSCWKFAAVIVYKSSTHKLYKLSKPTNYTIVHVIHPQIILRICSNYRYPSFLYVLCFYGYLKTAHFKPIRTVYFFLYIIMLVSIPPHSPSAIQNKCREVHLQFWALGFFQTDCMS